MEDICALNLWYFCTKQKRCQW